MFTTFSGAFVKVSLSDTIDAVKRAVQEVESALELRKSSGARTSGAGSSGGA